MAENALEGYFFKSVRKAGGKAYKLKADNQKGAPDRIALFPFGRVYFVELKDNDEEPTKRQEYEHEALAALGCAVFVLAGKEQIDEWIKRTAKTRTGA